MNILSDEQSLLSRRKAIKILAAASGAVSLSGLPNRWRSPLIEVGALPAHAETSPGGPIFRLLQARQLTPCENHGRHHIFIKVQDRSGQGLNGVPVKVWWADTPDGFIVTQTGIQQKWDGSVEPGRVTFSMFKGSYSVQVQEGTSQIANGLTADYGVDEPCGEDRTANSLYHLSFEVVFERSY